MSEENKNAVVAMLERTLAVVTQELETLARWADQASFLGRAARCLKRKERIAGGTRPALESLIRDVREATADAVTSSPAGVHDVMVIANEESAAARAAVSHVDMIADYAFTRFLERAEANAADSLRDAKTIVRDCTA